MSLCFSVTISSSGAVPELVANRMLGRIVSDFNYIPRVCYKRYFVQAFFLGVPVFGGLSIFVIFFVLSKKYDITIQPVVVAYATQLPFVIGLAGITYGILSSSWDEVSER